jgi:hypothetical protein
MNIQDVTSFLNQMLKVDKEGTSLLTHCRVEFNAEMLSHPLLVAKTDIDERNLSLLDIINSILLEESNQIICVDYDPEDPTLVTGFVVKKKWWS